MRLQIRFECQPSGGLRHNDFRRIGLLQEAPRTTQMVKMKMSMDDVRWQAAR